MTVCVNAGCTNVAVFKLDVCTECCVADMYRRTGDGDE